MNSGAAAHVHIERQMGDGILAVVSTDGGGSALDPVQKVIARDRLCFTFEANVDSRAADRDRLPRTRGIGRRQGESAQSDSTADGYEREWEAEVQSRPAEPQRAWPAPTNSMLSRWSRRIARPQALDQRIQRKTSRTEDQHDQRRHEVRERSSGGELVGVGEDG